MARRFIGRSGLCLACAVGIALSCSSSDREFGSSSKAGEAGQGSSVAGASSAGQSSDGIGGEAGALSDGGQAGALSDGGQAGALSDGGESGAAGSAGQSGASGDCEPGDSRSCSEGGALGPCAAGTQFCTVGATWSACSVKAAAADSCESGNDDNCNGTPNQGCLCINGVTKRACGSCSDGTQVCTDGKADQYGACQGAVKMPVKYYPDVDGDGYGVSAASVSSCIGAPSGYVDQAGDCCDDGGNPALAKSIHPGQATYFTVAANLCGITWNYDCSANDSIQLQIPRYLQTCTLSPCGDGSFGNYDAATCGTLLTTNCVCNTIGGANTCSVYCSGAQTRQGCH
jgi:hypothetical protein